MDMEPTLRPASEMSPQERLETITTYRRNADELDDEQLKHALEIIAFNRQEATERGNARKAAKAPAAPLAIDDLI